MKYFSTRLVFCFSEFHFILQRERKGGKEEGREGRKEGEKEGGRKERENAEFSEKKREIILNM